MAIVCDYVMAVWLRLAVADVPAEFEEQMLEYLQDEFQVNELRVIEDDDDADDEVTVFLRIQLTLDESQMDDDEPTDAAVAEFDNELRTYLSRRYEINYLDVLDDSPHSHLLDRHEDGDGRKYPEPKHRDLTEAEKIELRARIERGDGDIYALANEFNCSASQIAGIKAAMHR